MGAVNNKHFFAIYHFKTDDTSTPARQLWTGAIRPEGVKRVLACFENADGTPVTPESQAAAAASATSAPPPSANPSASGAAPPTAPSTEAK